jgi:hypothetical protein
MRYILAPFFMLVVCGSFAQSPRALRARITPDSVLQLMKDSFPSQNVYLHTDRDRYLAGDTVWFKAYLRTIGFPGGNSTGLHVELFNDSGVCVQKKVFAVYKGRFSVGNIQLADSLPQGRYTLRAYTEWMANFSPAYFYRYTFPVYGRKSATSAGVQDTSGSREVSIRFFPEGGAEVENVPGNVAFLVSEAGGKPLKIRGKVIDDRDSTVARFKSDHDGMGVFELTPVSGRRYKAVVWTPYGERRVPMPTPRSDGVALTVQADAKGVGFVLQADTQSRYLGRPLEVLASLHGQNRLRAKAMLTNAQPVARGYIPTDSLGAGVLMVSIFVGAGADTELLAERPVFIRSADADIPFSLSLDTLSTAPKGLNAWTLHVADTARGYLSVSVTDADALPAREEHPDILYGFLFGGDLEGYVYRPEQYLADASDSTRAALDLVMMTHDWRRLDWKSLEEGHYPELRVQPGKDYFTYRGKAVATSDNKPVGPGRVTLFLEGVDTAARFRSVPLDAEGHFVLDSLAFVDTASAYVMPGTAGGMTTDMRLSLAPDTIAPLGKVYGDTAPMEDTAFAAQAEREDEQTEAFRRRSIGKGKELKEVVVKGRKKTLVQVMDEKYAHGVFADQPGALGFSLENDKDAVNHQDIFTYLMDKVPGLKIIPGAYMGTESITYRNGHAPQLFLDEAPSDYVTIATMVHMADIAYVKFFPPPFVAAEAGGGSGAIAIYTRRGFDTRTKGNGLNRLLLAGYAHARPFYAPVYPAGDTVASREPDYRVTLAWNPLLTTSDSARSIPVRFYNNDVCRHYRVVVEGMDERGRLLHFERVVPERTVPGTMKNQ